MANAIRELLIVCHFNGRPPTVTWTETRGRTSAALLELLLLLLVAPTSAADEDGWQSKHQPDKCVWFCACTLNATNKLSI